MKFIPFALTTVVPLAVAAASNRLRAYGPECVSQSDAELLVSRYAAVISQSSSDLGGPVKTAKAIAAKGYTEQSDSANILGGIPLGADTVTSKHFWIYESQHNPPFPTTTQNVFAACHKVVWEWISNSFGSATYPVQGIHVFTVDSDGKIASVHFEFNSFAAGLDQGYTIYYPNGTKYGA